MPDPTVNEQIGRKLGYKPPGHKDTIAWLKRNGWNPNHVEWLTPNGDKVCLPPVFDTDPAAAMELLEHTTLATITPADSGGWCACICVDLSGNEHEGNGETICAAVAEAWLAAMEAKRG